MNGILKLESIRKFVKKNKKVTFIFFDTETTGLITKVGGTFLNTAGGRSEEENDFKSRERAELNRILKEREKFLDKEEYNAILHTFDTVEYDTFYKKKLKKFYNNPQLRKEYENISLHLNKWRLEELLKKEKNEIELTEFAAIKIVINIKEKEYEEPIVTKIHKYFKPTNMSDEIKKLTHWGPEKDALGSVEEARAKYQEIINFFNNTQGVTVIVAHNLLGFDLPAMTLFLKKFPKRLKRWNAFLKKDTTYALDTKDIASYFKIVTKKYPELLSSFETIPNTNFMRSNQAYLQRLTGVTNNSQHTAIADVQALLGIVEVLTKLFYYFNQKNFKEIYNKIIFSQKIEEILNFWRNIGSNEKNIYRGFVTSMLKKKFPQEDIVLEKTETDVTFKRARKFVNTKTKSSEKRKKFMAVFSAVKKSMLDSGQPIGIAIATGYKRAKESVGIQK